MSVCPFCGAEEICGESRATTYDCWTVKMDCEPGYHRGRMCYERQIDAQAERLEWTEEQLELCKDLRIEIEWLNEKFEACQKRYAGLLREYLKRMGFPNNEINKEIENELKDLGKI